MVEAFDRVWHSGLTTKLHSLDVCGGLLQNLQDYLQDRYFCVAVNGQPSQDHPICAGVTQGNVLGPLLWNVFFNDLLQLIPEAHAYLDDSVHSRATVLTTELLSPTLTKHWTPSHYLDDGGKWIWPVTRLRSY